jgi:NDP-sugar pyrophosphorylase family protein
MIRRAMILAAGRGRRLAPLTDTVPKPLVPVAGRPLLEHVLECLRAGGITDVVVNLHHLGARIQDHLGDGTRFDVRIQYSVEDPILDTGGGIKRAEPLLSGEPFVVANGDSLLELDVGAVVASHEARGALATMVVRPDPRAGSYGVVELDPEDRIRRVAGLPPGPPPETPWRTFMFPGLHVFDPAVFGFMDPDAVFSVTRVTYPRMIAAGCRVLGWVTEARWVTIDTPDALAAADRTLRGAPFRY